MTEMSEHRKEYLARYRKEHLKRIPLDVSPDFYDSIKRAADASGESINHYIKAAVRDRMIRSEKDYRRLR